MKPLMVYYKGMNIYFSGIGGVGIGPLAEIARDAGNSVCGSDMHESPTYQELRASGIEVSTDQSGAFLKACHATQPIDWFVHTAALPSNHPEFLQAAALGLHIAKRDELIRAIIDQHHLKLIAVAGTHGKTTTTAMLTWVFEQLGVPVSYSIGSQIGFGPSGHFNPESSYFVYECDEYDRNFLAFAPHLTLLTSVDYDHPDTYPTQSDYVAAFNQFLTQSRHTIMWRHDTVIELTPPTGSWVLDDQEVMDVKLTGAHNRANATLVVKAIEFLRLGTTESTLAALEQFPGSARRFEKLAENLYSDYGHHPVEIAATLELAREISDHVVLVYQPHQNTRQHQVRSAYTTCMQLAETIYWLPTYQSREDLNLPILTPEQLTVRLVNKASVHTAEMNESLWHAIEDARANNQLVLCMGAGSIDSWVRQQLSLSR